MAILALESTGAACSVALVARDGAVLADCHEEMPRGQSERLIPMVEQVMAKAGRDISYVTHVAVTRGPGAFTGIRLCLAAARGIALARKLPVLGFVSTEIIANAQPDRPPGTVLLIAIDSKRGDFHVQFFTDDGPEPPMALDEAGLCAKAHDYKRPLRVAGDAARDVIAFLTTAGIAADLADGPALPRASVLGQVCAETLNRADSIPMADFRPEPLYLRAPDVSAPDRDRARAPKAAG